MQSVCSWKLLGPRHPCEFGGCRRAGTVWTENKGRGQGENWGMGDYRDREEDITCWPKSTGLVTWPSSPPVTSSGTGLPTHNLCSQSQSGQVCRVARAQAGGRALGPGAPHARFGEFCVRRARDCRVREADAPSTSTCHSTAGWDSS